MRSETFLLLAMLILIGCSSSNQDGPTPNLNTNAGINTDLQKNQILAQKTFNVDPASDLAGYWYHPAISTSTANTTTNDVPKTITATFDDQNVIFRISNGETRAAKWIALPLGEIMTTISGKDIYWKVSIQGDDLVMNLRDKVPGASTTTAPGSGTAAGGGASSVQQPSVPQPSVPTP